LRARPEQTQLEELSDASFLGKLLVLPANVRLHWKEIARYKHSSLFGLIIIDEGKKFYNIDTRTDCAMSILPFLLFCELTEGCAGCLADWRAAIFDKLDEINVSRSFLDGGLLKGALAEEGLS
jgi:hypothetical protein